MAIFATNALYYRGIGSGIVRILAECPDIQLDNDDRAKEFKVTIWRTTQKNGVTTQKELQNGKSTTQKSEITTQKELQKGKSTTQKSENSSLHVDDLLLVYRIRKGEIIEAENVIRGESIGNYKTHGEILNITLSKD